MSLRQGFQDASLSGSRGGSRWDSLVVATCFITFGTVAAVMTVPDNLAEPDALFGPSLLMTLGLLIPPVLKIRADLTSSLRIENVMMLAIVYWLLLDLLQSAYSLDVVSSGDVQMAFIAIGCFAVAVWFGATGQGWSLPRIVSSTAALSINGQEIFIAIVISFILGMARFVIASGFDPITMIDGLAAERWGAPWARGQFGDWDAFSDHLTYFGYILPSLCVLLARRLGWRNIKTIVSIILAAIVLAFLAQSGGRRIIGVAVGAAIATWVVARPRLGARIVLGGAGASILLLVFLQEMLSYRNVGFGAWLSGESPESFPSYLHVDDNFLRLSQVVMFYPDTVEYSIFGPIFHALTLPIPRVIWPGKPIDAGFDLPLLTGVEGASLSCSIIGELWVSFGLLGVMLGGLIIGRLGGMWNKVLSLPKGDSRALMFSLGLMAMFAGMRSAQALVQMSYIVLAWIFVSSVIQRRRLTRR